MTTVGGGQFTVPADATTQAAAAQIAASTTPAGEAAGIAPTIRQATVVSNDGGTPPTCTVTFDGVTNVPGIRFAWPYTPVANDVVYCVVLGATTWVSSQLTTNADTAPRGPVGTVANGYTTQRGIAWHDANLTINSGGDIEVHGDYRITVPACSTRLIELRWNGMVGFGTPTVPGNPVIAVLTIWSGILDTQLTQVNVAGLAGVYIGFTARRRLAGPGSSTTYTCAVRGGNANCQLLSAAGYSSQFTIDDVGAV